ncbi:MAG: hypothetical protein UU63_C0041G0010 [Candidatus Uhrbacteria bacterium GW2011_GWF2_41_430]|nr:MAG: hypothetical protein UU63_C0041G0010 [Candidatus Uhrbacteria bacterium GW2011_GWF2_41_430]
MEFKDLSKKVVENAVSYGEKYNVQIDEDFAVLNRPC